MTRPSNLPGRIGRPQATRDALASRETDHRGPDAAGTLSRWSLLLLVLMLLAGCGEDDDTGPEAPSSSSVGLTTDELAAEASKDSDWQAGVTRELVWDDLIPADWQPERIMEEYDADNLTDEDPRAQELMDRLKQLWAEAPVVEGLDGRDVRIPGFVVPLEIDAKSVSEFLLVPYFGACIHVPPPPANQTVLVTTADGQPYQGGLFDTVWVEGRMRVTPFSNELGDAGYHVEDARVSIYEEP